MKKIGKAKNGLTVYDRKNSHLHAGVSNLLPVVLNEYSFTEEFVKKSHDFGFVIGKTHY